MSTELDRVRSERDAAFAELRRLRACDAEPYCPPLRPDPMVEHKQCPACGCEVAITGQMRELARAIVGAWSARQWRGGGKAYLLQLCGCQGRMSA